MATFPSITPQYSTQETVEQDSLRIKLGDGYEQRFVQGLPANKRLISLTLTFNVSTTDATTFDTFLVNHSDTLLVLLNLTLQHLSVYVFLLSFFLYYTFSSLATF